MLIFSQKVQFSTSESEKYWESFSQFFCRLGKKSISLAEYSPILKGSYFGPWAYTQRDILRVHVRMVKGSFLGHWVPSAKPSTLICILEISKAKIYWKFKSVKFWNLDISWMKLKYWEIYVFGEFNCKCIVFHEVSSSVTVSKSTLKYLCTVFIECNVTFVFLLQTQALKSRYWISSSFNFTKIS